ncbi:hypothetical protein Dsin_024007 [Dipteronia sinensis]|uniref:RNase H type-1 domain-containing protein n=1 Tax=Dipteronia sinensis TaxID=43782 RepID=A0AAE0E2M8_9ROSI|nr:hypothetical protein Dsin_024007 [Dipteronia sinensis]
MPWCLARVRSSKDRNICLAPSTRSGYGQGDWWRGWIWLCPKKESERTWVSLFFTVVWTIWEAMNGKVFKNEEASSVKAVDMVKFRVAWQFKNYGKGSSDSITLILLGIAARCTDPSKVKVPSLGDWIPPPSDVLKFNVDGSARSFTGLAGIGGVLRDSSWKVLRSFSFGIGRQDAITAEIMTIAKACELCISQVELTGRVIVINSDSKTVVSWINSDDLGNINFTHLIFDIRNKLWRLGQTTVEYSSRLSNSMADSLAKKGSAGGGM